MLPAHKVFFTSDTHYSHAGIIRMANRPFASIQEMDNELIHRFNAVVPPDGVTYHLGDFSLGGIVSSTIRKRLNGRIHLCPGNHSKRSLMEPELWESISPMYEICIDGQLITLCHYAMLAWYKRHKGAWMLHGDAHGGLRDDPEARRLDVGVDCWEYAPVSMSQIRARLSGRTPSQIDHHEIDLSGKGGD